LGVFGVLGVFGGVWAWIKTLAGKSLYAKNI